MKVRIIRAGTAKEVIAEIKKGKISQMPSIQQGWRFNFDRELRNLKNATGYILVTEETPEITEGCMIFQLIDKKEPYMAFLEVAPHNRTNNKKYDYVAGCLIAYAYKLSLIEGWDYYKGYLQFDILEQNRENEEKLMGLYSSKYNAKRIKASTTMVITDDDGDALIAKYLKPITDK